MSGDDRNDATRGQPPIVQRGRGDPRGTTASSPAVRSPWGNAAPLPMTGDLGHRGTPGRIESFSGGAPPGRLVEDARFGELYVLFIINLLLGIITLGIYRFWGKTRIRKYVWSHMSFRGERFEYSGTGRELFLGFLIALAIFGPPFFGFTIWVQLEPFPDPRTEPGRLLLIYGLLFVLILISFYFSHVAIFAAYRYRLTRTLWHGIRGTVDGSAWYYGWLGFGLALLNSISLGWTQPWAHTVLLNYRLSRTKIGTIPVQGAMNTQGLYGPFAIAWTISAGVGFLAIVAIAIIVAGSISEANPTRMSEITLAIVGVIAYLAVPATWLITVNWYRAALLRKFANTFTADQLKFAFPVKGGTLLWFNFSNALILIFTLGLLYPYVILRYARFVSRHLAIEGMIDYAAWQQSGDWRPSTGEGMAEFFGIGVI